MFKAISEMVWNSGLTPSQKFFSSLFLKAILKNQTF